MFLSALFGLFGYAIQLVLLVILLIFMTAIVFAVITPFLGLDGIATEYVGATR